MKRQILFILLSITLVTSCGDMSKKTKNNSASTGVSVCEPDTDALKKFLEQNIQDDLNCLNDALNFFSEIATSERPGSLSYVALNNHITNNMPDADQATFDILRAVFDFNALLTGDDKNYISKKNMDTLFGLFKKINEVLVKNKVYAYFTDFSEISLDEHNRRKAKIYFAFTQLEEWFYSEYKHSDNSLDLQSFIEHFRSFAGDSLLRKVKNALFVKKIFLGGDNQTITSLELKRLIGMLSDSAKILYDISHLGYIKFEKSNVSQVTKTLKEGVETIVRNFYVRSGDIEVFKLEDIFQIVREHFSKYKEYLKYKESLLKLKKIFLKNDSDVFDMDELSILVESIILKNLKRSSFFFDVYENNKEELNKKGKITHNLRYTTNKDSIGGPKDIPLTQEEKNYLQAFNRIVQDYSNFKGVNASAYYKGEIERNASAIAEIAIIEDLVTRLFAYYAQKRDESAYGGYQISLGTMTKILTDFKEVFRGEGLQLDPASAPEGVTYKPREKNTAETITLLASLFQSQSNGIPVTDDEDPDVIEVNEMTEFAVALLSAMSYSNTAKDYFQSVCAPDEKGEVVPSCYRKNFVNFFETEVEKGVELREYLPKLYENIKDMREEELANFLTQVEVFSRSCTHYDKAKKEEINMGHVDYFMLMAGVLAMESTFNRFDTGAGFHRNYVERYSNNNNLEIPEVERAYDELYKGAVLALIPVNFLKRYGKWFYFYLVTYNKLPDVQNVNSLKDFWRATKEGLHFGKFLLKRKKKRKAQASRFTLAMVLRILSEQSETNIENPYPCESLR